MTEAERLHAAVLSDLSDPLVKLALADALEEQGDQRIVVNDRLWVWSADYAYALRWMASRGKYPWRIAAADYNRCRWHSQKMTGKRSVAALPQEVFDLLPIERSGRTYSSDYLALVYLAEVLTRLRDVVSLAPLPLPRPPDGVSG
jgi:hypothetical protein